MNWISGLQKAIDYIECHLTEELEAADIAAQANYSPYHFQRVFGILCGYSLGEYIRMRRLLSMAMIRRRVLEERFHVFMG